jgi:hypothetical protein
MRPITTRGGPSRRACQRITVRRPTRNSRANSIGLMYSPAMHGAAGFSVSMSGRCFNRLVFMGAKLPRDARAVYVPVFQKANRGQFSGKKLSVYAGVRTDANFVRSAARGQFAMLNQVFLHVFNFYRMRQDEKWGLRLSRRSPSCELELLCWIESNVSYANRKIILL